MNSDHGYDYDCATLNYDEKGWEGAERTSNNPSRGFGGGADEVQGNRCIPFELSRPGRRRTCSRISGSRGLSPSFCFFLSFFSLGSLWNNMAVVVAYVCFRWISPVSFRFFYFYYDARPINGSLGDTSEWRFPSIFTFSFSFFLSFFFFAEQGISQREKQAEARAFIPPCLWAERWLLNRIPGKSLNNILDLGFSFFGISFVLLACLGPRTQAP